MTANDIVIHAHTVTEIIQHSYKSWTTLFIEYNTDDKDTHYRYDVNGITGSFISPVRYDIWGGFALGSRWDDTYFLNGQIASLELYWTKGTSATFPEPVKRVLIKNQNISV